MGERKKILIWEVLGYVGGGQKMSLIISQIMKTEYDVEFIIPEEGELSEELKKSSIPYHIINIPKLALGNKSMLDMLTYLINSKRILKSVEDLIEIVKPNILYAPGPNILPLAAVAGEKKNVSVVWHLHHIFSDRKTLLLLNLSSRLKSVKRILSVSDVVGEQIKEKIARDKVRTVYNPIQIEKYNKCIDQNKLRSEFGLDDSDLIIEHIGFLQEQKNQELSIRMLKRVRDQGYPAKLLLIGEARPGNESYKRKLIGLIDDLGLNNSVVFTGYRNDIPDLLQIAVVVVVVMSQEGCPLVALEAMASGKPLISVNTGGGAEVVERAQSGYLFDQGTDAYISCADKVTALLSSTSEQRRFSDNGRRFAAEHSFDKFRIKIINEFKNIIDS